MSSTTQGPGTGSDDGVVGGEPATEAEATSEALSATPSPDHPARGPRRAVPAPRPASRASVSSVETPDIPETLRYRMKNKLLGPPLVTEQLTSERLSRTAALGVLSPDCISSSAYGTEQMLTQLVPYVGLAAFTLVVPITMAILGVLFFVTLSYLEVIALYTKVGGSYVVARDNFGPKVAQVAAVALLIDYTVTVAVQTSAGTAVLTSAIPSLRPLTVAITVAVVVLLIYGNLRGIKEGAKFFAFPTFFFIFSLGFIIIAGVIKEAMGTLPVLPLPPTNELFDGKIGTPGSGWLMGLAFISLLRSFANGGSSLTGLEAISNGVSSFKKPESKHARQTLVVMSSVLAFLVLGVTMLARWTHAVPYEAGTPTVVSQEVRAVVGHSPIGNFLFLVIQFGTVAILYTGGNTSFNGFPFLASFVAGDRFLPRQLTKRGHRLAFSNGIIVLGIVAITLILVFKAQVNGLVALYAVGVFTGFALAGSGMVKHHLTHRDPHWRRGVAINGFSAFLTATVVAIFVFAKFREGAWIVVVVGPLLYFSLLRLHGQYEVEAQELEVGAARACEAPILRHHVVVVLVDRLDMAVARAIQYPRTLTPDDLRAVHFDIDSKAARELEREWSRLGLARMPLDIIECPDRRLARAAVELVADAVAAGDTECTVLLPRRGFASGWRRFLHDRTADKLADVLGHVAHVSATIIPFNLTGRWVDEGRAYQELVADHLIGTPEASIFNASEPAAIDPAPARGRRRRERTDGPDREGRTGVGPSDPTRPDKTEQPLTKGSRAKRREHHKKAALSEVDQALTRRSKGTEPIAQVELRRRVKVAGRIKSVRVQPRGGTSNLECVLSDGTGGILLVFQGRPRIPGIEPGARLVAEGMAGAWGRRTAILNPDYELIAGAERDPTDDGH